MTLWQVAEVQRRLARDDRVRCAVCGHVADLHHPGPPITCAICPDDVCQLPPEPAPADVAARWGRAS